VRALASGNRLNILRVGILGAVGILLVWQVVSGSLVAFLAGTAPEAALKLRPDDPRALLKLAERHFQANARLMGALVGDGGRQTRGPTGDASVPSGIAASLEKSRPAYQQTGSIATPMPPNTVQQWAERALAGDPLNARALSLLGLLADAQGDGERAERYMQLAARASVQESVAAYWLMQRKYEQRDYDAAIYFADTLLRTRTQALPHVVPILARIAENPAANDKLKLLLASNPPWRARFFSALPMAVSDARTPLELLLSLRDSGTPATQADLREYLNVLMEHKLYELAYYAWLQFLPSEQLTNTAMLFNGSFEFTPSGLPFDWSMPAGTGVTVDIAERPDQRGHKALLIQLGPGRVEFPGVRQTLLLGPGAYRFRGQYKGEIKGRRGLVWRVSCVGAPAASIGQSQMMVGSAPAWQQVEFLFSVPEVECRAQHLRLELDARMASEQLVSGSIWYDELAISPR
jgi:tetratricopeptide (TPR) repeat protein